jgi:hypothetical protein
LLDLRLRNHSVYGVNSSFAYAQLNFHWQRGDEMALAATTI